MDGGALPSPPETRARSRSKTPFTKSSEENGKDGKKSPDLQAITEDLETTASSTPIKTSKRQSASQKSAQSSATSVTTTTTVIQSSTSSSSAVSTRKSAASSNGNSNEVTTTPPASKKGNISKEMKELENKRTKEIKQSEVSEKVVKKTITSTPKMSPPSPSSASFKLNSSHEDLDLDKHPAYKQYIEAGEYWNKTPKTDYTYSENSVDRREIGQGYVAMPNMSRKSLDRHVERVNTMIRNNPEQEAYLRQRYQFNPSTTRSNKSFKLFSRSLLNYDSGDEVDLSHFDRRTTRIHQESVVKRTVVRVWVWITSLFTVFRRTSVTQDQFRAQYGVQRESLWSRIKTTSRRSWAWIVEKIVTVFKKIYLFFASVLYLDTLLVRQRRIVETASQERGAGDASTVTAADVELFQEEEMPPTKRRFLWILAALLPILLIAGFVANSNLETAQIREFLLATQNEVGQRCTVARAGLDAMRMDTVEFARRNFDTAQAKTLELVEQVRLVWTENSAKLVETVQATWAKIRSS